MSRLCAVLAVLWLACAASAPERPPLTAEETKALNASPVCTTPTECQQMWARAQVWVSQNAGYKIQLANETLIQTYGPGDDALVAVTVTKVPETNANWEIDGRIQCRSYTQNYITHFCPDLKRLLVHFNRYVATGSGNAPATASAPQ